MYSDLCIFPLLFFVPIPNFGNFVVFSYFWCIGRHLVSLSVFAFVASPLFNFFSLIFITSGGCCDNLLCFEIFFRYLCCTHIHFCLYGNYIHITSDCIFNFNLIHILCTLWIDTVFGLYRIFTSSLFPGISLVICFSLGANGICFFCRLLLCVWRLTYLFAICIFFSYFYSIFDGICCLKSKWFAWAAWRCSAATFSFGCWVSWLNRWLPWRSHAGWRWCSTQISSIFCRNQFENWNKNQVLVYYLN